MARFLLMLTLENMIDEFHYNRYLASKRLIGSDSLPTVSIFQNYTHLNTRLPQSAPFIAAGRCFRLAHT